MAAHGARRLIRMNANLRRIVGVELLCAAQGIEFRMPLSTSPRLQAVLARLRQTVPSLVSDRVLSADIESAASLVQSGLLVAAANEAGNGGATLPELGDGKSIN